jgi:hypothetical protein
MSQIALARFPAVAPSLAEAHAAEVVGPHDLETRGGAGTDNTDKVRISLSADHASGFPDVSMNGSLLQHLARQQVEHLTCTPRTTARTTSHTSGTHLAPQESDNRASPDELHQPQKRTGRFARMFDTLRQIIDRYNETAKGTIQSIGR